MAAAEGLEFIFDQAVPGNTFDAHRLLHYAREVGLQDELKEALFQAYFRDGRSIGRPEVLAEVATEVGLDRAVTDDILGSDRFGPEVRADEAEAHRARRIGCSVLRGRPGLRNPRRPRRRHHRECPQPGLDQVAPLDHGRDRRHRLV